MLRLDLEVAQSRRVSSAEAGGALTPALLCSRSIDKGEVALGEEAEVQLLPVSLFLQALQRKGSPCRELPPSCALQ